MYQGFQMLLLFIILCLETGPPMRPHFVAYGYPVYTSVYSNKYEHLMFIC